MALLLRLAGELGGAAGAAVGWAAWRGEEACSWEGGLMCLTGLTLASR